MSYVTGFLLPVKAENKDRYIESARKSWPAFQKYGCLEQIECWGEDVPRGEQTDFFRATQAQEGEVPMFSWTAWPDRATCDAAAKAMEASMEGKEFPEMPFDGKRMMWGGFEVVFDSAQKG